MVDLYSPTLAYVDARPKVKNAMWFRFAKDRLALDRRREWWLHNSTGIGQVLAVEASGYATKPTGRRILLFTMPPPDGRIIALTRDAIDKGLPQAAGIPIIDGDMVEGGDTPAAAALALATPAGSA